MTKVIGSRKKKFFWRNLSLLSTLQGYSFFYEKKHQFSTLEDKSIARSTVTVVLDIFSLGVVVMAGNLYSRGGSQSLLSLDLLEYCA